MKDPRAEKIINELRETVNRLNRIDGILQRMDVRYSLHRYKKDEPWRLEDIVQEIEYQ